MTSMFQEVITGIAHFLKWILQLLFIIILFYMLNSLVCNIYQYSCNPLSEISMIFFFFFFFFFLLLGLPCFEWFIGTTALRICVEDPISKRNTKVKLNLVKLLIFGFVKNGKL